MLMFLHGPDTYRSRQRLHQLKEGFTKKYDPSGTSTAVLDGSKVTFDMFRRTVMASGFLAPKRLIIVDGLIGGSKKTELQKQIVEFLDSDEWNDKNVLIFWEGDVATATRPKKRPAKSSATKKSSPRTTKPLLARLMSEHHVEVFPLLSPAEIGTWIRQEVKRQGGAIQPAALELLVADVGPDLWRLTQEIAKLVGLRARGEITAKDVREMVAPPYDDNIFHLTDVLADKNLKDSLRIFGELLASGMHELYILTMLIRQFRILTQVRDIITTEPHPATVASRLHLHPYVAQRSISQAKKFTPEQLTQIYRELVNIDASLKTSQQGARVLFDLFAVNVCT